MATGSTTPPLTLVLATEGNELPTIGDTAAERAKERLCSPTRGVALDMSWRHSYSLASFGTWAGLSS